MNDCFTKERTYNVLRNNRKKIHPMSKLGRLKAEILRENP